jgi:hypothetical protein
MSRRLQAQHAALWAVMGYFGAGRLGAAVLLSAFLLLALIGELLL